MHVLLPWTYQPLELWSQYFFLGFLNYSVQISLHKRIQFIPLLCPGATFGLIYEAIKVVLAVVEEL